MHLFDTARHRLGNGLPEYTDCAGYPLGALNGLRVEPQPDGSFLAEVFLATRPNSFSAYHKAVVSAAELWSLLQDYCHDPEDCFTRHFGWIRPEHLLPPPTPKVSLEELGL